MARLFVLKTGQYRISVAAANLLEAERKVASGLSVPRRKVHGQLRECIGGVDVAKCRCGQGLKVEAEPEVDVNVEVNVDVDVGAEADVCGICEFPAGRDDFGSLKGHSLPTTEGGGLCPGSYK